MAASDYLRLYMESLAAEGLDPDALGDLEADIIGRVGRMRITRDRAHQCAEAARLLHEGVDALAERQHCHRSTAYRRAERGAKDCRATFPQRDKSAV